MTIQSPCGTAYSYSPLLNGCFRLTLSAKPPQDPHAPHASPGSPQPPHPLFAAQQPVDGAGPYLLRVIGLDFRNRVPTSTSKIRRWLTTRVGVTSSSGVGLGLPPRVWSGDHAPGSTLSIVMLQSTHRLPSEFRHGRVDGSTSSWRLSGRMFGPGVSSARNGTAVQRQDRHRPSRLRLHAEQTNQSDQD